MFPAENDYNPIVREGQVELGSGILARRRARQSVPDASHGEEVVLIGADGAAVSGRGTAGERYWGSARGWVIVDVSDHHLSFHFSYRDPDGAASYEIAALATVTVSDAAATVRRRARGVRAYVESALRSTATRSLSSSLRGDGGDTLSKLNARLGSHAELLRRFVGTGLSVADWLLVTITDLSIQFDGSTSAHYDQLVAADRAAEVSNRTLINRKQTTMHEIELRQTWADYLGGQMSDPLRRAVAAAAADPTPDNIREVSNKLDEDDRWQRGQFVETLNRLIDRNVIVEIEDIRNTKVIIDGLQKGITEGDSSRSQPSMMIEDAEIVDDHNALPPDDSDHDWSN